MNSSPARPAQPESIRPPITPERRAIVDRAREGWMKRLIDVSRRNNLLYFRELKVGTLDISAAEPTAFASLLKGDVSPLSRLLPTADQTTVSAKLVEIQRRAVANLEERGLETLYLALGMATWPASDGGRPSEAAVLLAPIRIESSGRGSRSMSLQRSGEAQLNLVLLHLLESEFGCKISPEQLLAGMDAEDTPLDPNPAYERMSSAAASIKGFTITPRAVLGNFSFQKMAMVRDLRERADDMAAHDLIAALAGERAARDAVGAARSDLDPRELDNTRPEQEFLILDADSSQQKVVTLALRGMDGVIQGPPGTGKSQTIANLIAAFAADGKRVLFVAEKRAALEVVLKRLQALGLGHMALDIHGADMSRREVMQRMSESLQMVRDAAPINTEAIQQGFAERRRRLNEHVMRLHVPRAPSGLSYYELQGRLLRLPPETRVSTRWRIAELGRFTKEYAASTRDMVQELAGFGGLYLRDGSSPWSGANLPNGSAAQQAADAAIRVARDRLPAVKLAVTPLVAAAQAAMPNSVEETRGFVALMAGVAQTLTTFKPGLFDQDLRRLEQTLAPARNPLTAALGWATNSTYRKALQSVRLLCVGPAPSAARLLREITVIANQQERWRALSPSAPVACQPADIQQAQTQLDRLSADLSVLVRCLNRNDLARLPVDQLTQFFEALAAESNTPYRIPHMLDLERTLNERGAGALLVEIRSSQKPLALGPQIFDYAWLSSCMDQARSEEPALAGFNGQTHQVFIDEFRQLDLQRLNLSAARVRRQHAEHVITTMNTYAEETALVRRESEKKTRHLPLRKLLAQAPHVLTALNPCWMASPLSVSQLLDSAQRYFDVVVFDEASQVLPEDAVAALLRGSRAIVAGDKHQLPPTTFFAAGDDEERADSDSLTEGFESILDLMSAFLQPWSLEWHYRSRDESLIAFSNRHIYGNRLITFPGPGGPPVVQHVLVQQELRGDGESESSSPEVQRVVELILQHATERPEETLGVIAMGITHAQRIQAALDRALDSQSELDAFFDQSKPERFFVKNLERVQGDERDAIILSIGYSKDRTGRLLYHFGPLLTDGGERRLNVAITRARNRMTLVSSFDHTDMDPGRSTARGVELLRLYLQYAASRGEDLGDKGLSSVPINSFEADVLDALNARGMGLLSQWGASRYRIDFVAQHPARPGRFVLAIECDGASYHSAPTARERDRLRQQHLEALGWHFYRIWSTDWFVHREKEIERAVAAFQAAVKSADAEDAQGVRAFASGAPEPVATPQPASIMPRAPKPVIPRRNQIGDYALSELVSLVNWIGSDKRLRTDEEIVREMIDVLGFKRRGTRIETAIRSAISESRRKSSEVLLRRVK